MQTVISPEELPKWVPGEVLNASDNLGWNDVFQRSYRYAGQDVEVPPMDHYMLVRYCYGQTPMQRCFNGKWSKTICSEGDVSLLTSAQGSHWYWTKDVDVSHVYLSGDMMSRVACDILEKSIEEINLHDVLKTTDPILVRLIDNITREAQSPCIGGTMYVEALGLQLAIHLLRNYANVTVRNADLCDRLSKSQRCKLIEYIDTNMQNPIRLKDLAGVVGLGVWTFSRKFSKSFDCPPHTFVTNCRVKKAKELLTFSTMAIKEIAFHCGFSDQAHLTRVIRSKLGVTPGKLKNN